MSITEAADRVWLQTTLAHIRGTFLPIILAGTVTNILNFVVLSHREMRSVSTAVYLLALAVADLGVMYLELFRVWFEWTQLVDPRLYFSDSYCRVVNYANGVARDYSNWLIACVTMERLAMIACPYKARDMCTTNTVCPTVTKYHSHNDARASLAPGGSIRLSIGATPDHLALIVHPKLGAPKPAFKLRSNGSRWR